VVIIAVVLAPAEVMAEGMETDEEETMEGEAAEEPADPEEVTLN